MNIYTRIMGNNYQLIGLEHAKLLNGGWRNFSAEQRAMDNGGTHHFNILIENEEDAEKLKAFGFNVGYYQPQNGGAGYFHLDCNISWKLREPVVQLISGTTTTPMNETTIGDLDHLNNIDYIDVELSPYHWNNNGRSGVKPYVNEMYVYLMEPSPIQKRWQNRTTVEGPSQPELDFALADDENDIPF